MTQKSKKISPIRNLYVKFIINTLKKRNPKQYKRHQLLLSIAILCIIAILSGMDYAGLLYLPQNDLIKYHSIEATVLRVVDGDTLIIDLPDRKKKITRIRLWGIDTPETAKPRYKRKSQWLADEAMAFTQKQCEKQKVTLLLETHSQRGKFGRLLAYIKLKDGSILNENLLKAGLAKYENRFSHSHLQKYKQIYLTAKEKGVGLWHKVNRKAYLKSQKLKKQSQSLN